MEQLNNAYKDDANQEIKPWEELTLADNFIFQKVMQNEELCKKVLSEILGKEIIRIEYPDYEKAIDIRRDAKSIRLDVYVLGDDTAYDIEIHNTNFKALPLRIRYYGDLMDLDLLKKGQDYYKLEHRCVIFICTFDFFNLNHYKYTFTYKCEEIEGLKFEDLTTNIILNTQGTKGEVSEDLKIFLKAINGVFSNDSFSAKIKGEYDKVKDSREARLEYMTLEMELRSQYEAGIKKGEILTLIALYNEGTITLEKALEKSGLAKMEFMEKIEEINKKNE